MRKLIIALALATGLVVGVNPPTLAPALAHPAPTSSAYTLAAWKHATGYTGPVCILAPKLALDSAGIVKCVNGVPATKASINAGWSYGAWISCERDHEKFACTFETDF